MNNKISTEAIKFEERGMKYNFLNKAISIINFTKLFLDFKYDTII